MIQAKTSTRIGIALATLVVASAGSWAADRAAAEKQLKEAIKAGVAENVQKACDALIECGGKDALNVILNLAPTTEGSVYWQLTGAGSGFQDRAALEEVGRFIVAHQNDAKVSLSRDLLFQLQNNSSPYVAVPVGYVLERGKYDLQLMAVDQLAVTRSVESIDALVKVNKIEHDPELHRRIEHALELLTGQQNADAAAWDSWWQGQRSKGVPEKKAPAGAEGGGSGGGTIEKPRDNEFKTVERGDKEHVIVISSDRTGLPDGGHTVGNMTYQDGWEFDKMERILEAQKIPHTVVKKDDFEKEPEEVSLQGVCGARQLRARVDAVHLPQVPGDDRHVRHRESRQSLPDELPPRPQADESPHEERDPRRHQEVGRGRGRLPLHRGHGPH